MPKLTKRQQQWLERENRTWSLVRASYEHLRSKRRGLGGSDIEALCQLTWITRSYNDSYWLRTKLPALAQIFRFRADEVWTTAEMADAVSEADDDAALRALVLKKTGFANLYSAFRPAVAAWASRNLTVVRRIIRDAYAGSSHARIVRNLEKLPGIPRSNAGALPAHKLLTPVVACLDPARRFPIINSHRGISQLLGLRRVRTSPLAIQYDALQPLFEQFGIKTAFELDVWSWKASRAITPYKKPPARKSTTRGSGAGRRPLELKDISDVTVIATHARTKQVRLHNEMTNQLLALTKAASLAIDEGFGRFGKFDCLIYAYSGHRRDLLIEAKSSLDRASIRLAVGQLLDYRRHAPNRHQTDLAVLLPSRPDRDTREFLAEVGIKTLWFTRDLAKVRGDFELG